MQPIPVSAILRRVPERARAAHRCLSAHPGTKYDPVTGWAYAYCSQEELARVMGCALRTVTRAVADLRRVGLVRVFAWPGAQTETGVRVDAVVLPVSVFGPVRRMQEAVGAEVRVDQAIAQLVREHDEILWDIELSFGCDVP